MHLSSIGLKNGFGLKNSNFIHILEKQKGIKKNENLEKHDNEKHQINTDLKSNNLKKTTIDFHKEAEKKIPYSSEIKEEKRASNSKDMSFSKKLFSEEIENIFSSEYDEYVKNGGDSNKKAQVAKNLFGQMNTSTGKVHQNNFPPQKLNSTYTLKEKKLNRTQEIPKFDKFDEKENSQKDTPVPKKESDSNAVHKRFNNNFVNHKKENPNEPKKITKANDNPLSQFVTSIKRGNFYVNQKNFSLLEELQMFKKVDQKKKEELQKKRGISAKNKEEDKDIEEEIKILKERFALLRENNSKNKVNPYPMSTKNSTLAQKNVIANDNPVYNLSKKSKVTENSWFESKKELMELQKALVKIEYPSNDSKLEKSERIPKYYMHRLEQAYKYPDFFDFFNQIYREHFFQTCQAINFIRNLNPPDSSMLHSKMINLPKKETHKSIFDSILNLIYFNR